ncbi:MAG: hypothetical protein ACKO96_41180 [Flammeovirgaceae bacterium]
MEKKEGISIDSADVKLFTTEELTTRETNLKKEHEKMGYEIGIKKLSEKLGVERTNDGDKLIELVSAKAVTDAKLPTDEKLKALQSEKEALQQTIQTITGEKDTLKADFEGYKNNVRRDSMILSAIPDNTILPKSDIALIVQSKFDFRFDNGQAVVVDKSTGQELKDNLMNFITPEKAIGDFFTQNAKTYLKGSSGGGGGDDTSTNSKMSTDQFMEIKTKEGVHVQSAEFQTAYAEAQKNGQIQD